MAQFQLTNPGNNPAHISSITLTGSGTGNFPSGITTVNLYLDINGNGTVDVGDTLAGTGTYSGGNATINLNQNIPAGSSATFLVVYQFSNSAPSGAYTTQVTGASGTNASGSLQFSGLPQAAATITLVSATVTPTATSTKTSTPTPVGEDVITPPYPNPVSDGPVRIDVSTPGPATAEWSVFTLNFRKIISGRVAVNGTGTIQWDLKDKNGVRVADGLYYIRVEIHGSPALTKVYKILVLH